MRSILGTILLFLATAAIEASDYPYRAVVAHLNVNARSAPSYGAYPTEALPKGTEVEVHAAGPKGWLAIRPTSAAFDWIVAAAIQPTEDPTVGLVASEAAVQIGSNVRDVEKHRSETTLKPGDAVEILPLSEEEKTETAEWIRIAPPAGEFRWVQEKFLLRASVEDLAAREAEAAAIREEERLRENATQPPGLLERLVNSPAVRKLSEVADESSLELAGGKAPPILGAEDNREAPETSLPPVLELAPPRAEPRTAARSERIPLTERTARSSPRRTEGVNGETRKTLDPRLLRAPEKERETVREEITETPPEPTAKRRSPPLGSAEFRDLMQRLEVDLTEMVSAESSQWRLDSLRARAEALVEDGATPLERGRARLLLERIEAFSGTLPPDHDPLTSPAAIAASSVPAPRAIDPLSRAVESLTRPATPATDFGPGPQYDAVGYLMPVLGAPAGTPSFQLTDAQGNTLQFVSPAPGVNLSRYTKKQVGIYGSRGYLESVKKQHVTAERIVDLDRHRR